MNWNWGGAKEVFPKRQNTGGEKSLRFQKLNH
jgi:hypothetical protein